MKKILALLMLLTALEARPATIWWALTNWDATLSTNATRITPVAQSPSVDGQYAVIGLPKLFPSNTNWPGLWTNSFLAGNYKLEVIGIAFPNPIYFQVGTNVNQFNSVFDAGVLISGGNFFVTGIGTNGAGLNIPFDPTQFDTNALITIKNLATVTNLHFHGTLTGDGSASGAIVLSLGTGTGGITNNAGTFFNGIGDGTYFYVDSAGNPSWTGIAIGDGSGLTNITGASTSQVWSNYQGRILPLNANANTNLQFTATNSESSTERFRVGTVVDPGNAVENVLDATFMTTGGTNISNQLLIKADGPGDNTRISIRAINDDGGANNNDAVVQLISPGSGGDVFIENSAVPTSSGFFIVGAFSADGNGLVTANGFTDNSGTPKSLVAYQGSGSLGPTNLSGDITTSGSSVTTLKNTGTAGTYTKTTFDAQGRETSGTTLSASDIPTLTVSKLSDAGTAAYSNATAFALSGTTITVAGTANQITSSAGAQDLSANRTWTLSLPSSVIFPGTITVTGETNTSLTANTVTVAGGDKQAKSLANAAYGAQAGAYYQAPTYGNNTLSMTQVSRLGSRKVAYWWPGSALVSSGETSPPAVQGAAAVQIAATVSTHRSLEFYTPATTANTNYVNDASSDIPLGKSGVFNFWCQCTNVSLANTRMWVGLSAAWSSNANAETNTAQTYVAFLGSSTNWANWQFVIDDATANHYSIVDTGVALTTLVTNFTVIINGSGSAFINAVGMLNQTLVATNTPANLPTGVVKKGIAVATLANAASGFRVASVTSEQDY